MISQSYVMDNGFLEGFEIRILFSHSLHSYGLSTSVAFDIILIPDEMTI